MSPLHALIVEDEPPARRLLRSLLAPYDDVVVAGEATSVAAAAEVLAARAFDLIFLDVQLPDGSGFDLFDRVPIHTPVIFVTGFDEFALRAFEVNALDYLLKPVDPARLERALDRLRRGDSGSRPPARLRLTDAVCLRDRGGYRFVRIDDIMYFEAQDKYTEAHLVDGTTELCDVSMVEWEARLPESDFIRVHRRSIVRVTALERLQPEGDSGWVVRIARTPEPIRVGRSYLPRLRERFQLK